RRLPHRWWKVSQGPFRQDAHSAWIPVHGIERCETLRRFHRHVRYRSRRQIAARRYLHSRDESRHSSDSYENAWAKAQTRSFRAQLVSASTAADQAQAGGLLLMVISKP